MRERALYGALFVSGMLAFAAGTVRLHDLLLAPPVVTVAHPSGDVPASERQATDQSAPERPASARTAPVATDGAAAGEASTAVSVPIAGSAQARDLEPVAPVPGSEPWPPSRSVGGPFVVASPAPDEYVRERAAVAVPAGESGTAPEAAAPATQGVATTPSVAPPPAPTPADAAPAAAAVPAADAAAAPPASELPPSAVETQTAVAIPAPPIAVPPPAAAAPHPRAGVPRATEAPAKARRRARAGILVVRGAPPSGLRGAISEGQPGARVIPLAPPAARMALPRP